MAQSSEYPDLRWMPPASWTNANRSSVQLIVIHTTEGSEGPSSAEDGASYDQRRTDGTSTHFFHDSNSTVQCVRTADIAHTARHQGNLRGVQHELCGRAGQGNTGWADANSQGTLRQAAKQCARDAKKWGIPVRKLTTAQVADGARGFCGHVEITYAFPQDNGTHTDPGPTFPWSDFLGMVQAELEGDMADLTPQNLDDIALAVAVKLHKDLSDKTTGLYGSLTARNRDAINQFWSDAYHASMNDGIYTAADAGVQQRMRFARDIVRGAVGGPVSEANLQAAIGQVDEEVWAKVPDPGVSIAEKAELLRRWLGDDAIPVGLILGQAA
jgi:hypothetical protein